MRTDKSVREDVFEKDIIKFKGNCFTFTAPINPGDYVIPFEFDLPANIPSSIIWHD